ncbi:autotransporter outer membrane beta-barrel domain-containing protein [Microbulbifer sp. SAOS-129_SWC]|uniref:autotransporter family protein n=1 Tax=Microbulbifer sp. SAOS-129_SWC TaxID=3145235 RepID=UPI00321706DB
MSDLRTGPVLARCAGLLLAASFSSPQIVLASCTDHLPANGASVTCSGNDSIGVHAAGASNVSVTIDAGASITTAQAPAVVLGAGASVRNYGSLSSGDPYTVQLSGGDNTFYNSGTIGGGVSLGGGNNRIELGGGRIGTWLVGSSGADTLDWHGGWVGDGISLGGGDDRATLRGIDGADHTPLDGGTGYDSLLLDHQVFADPAKLGGWESIRLGEGSNLTLNNPLQLGDIDALPARLVLDPGSQLLLPEFDGKIAASGALLLDNNGTIDLRGGTANQLTVGGDYRGSGRIYLDVTIGGDDASGDRLVIDGGHASGGTELAFATYGNSGQATDQGILVVETRNGGSSAADAFYMAAPIASGPYEYYLFRGTPGEDDDNWYLRSTLLPGSAAPATASPAMQTGSGTSQPLALAPTATTPVPLYRPEIPLYAQIKGLAQQLSLQQISSYQQRRGEQLSGGPGNHGGWLRLDYRPVQMDWGGDMPTRFDGYMSGLQLNGNLWAGPTCHGSEEWGLFAGSSTARGNVTGLARGNADYRAGTNRIDSYYFGAYFTDYRNSGGYFDLLFKAGYLNAESRSSRDINTSVHGPQLSLSLEKGFAPWSSATIGVEPQLQVIANYTNLTAYEDGYARVEPDMTPELTFRAGLRAYNRRGDNRYYLFGNLWHTLHGHDELLFDTRLFLEDQRRATWGELGAGVDLLQFRTGSLYFNLSYQQSLDYHRDWRGASGNLGFDLNW